MTEPVAESLGGLVVRVLPDVSGLDKAFDYLVPRRWRDQVRVGTRVRVTLHGRRVGGWVIEVGAQPATDAELKAIAKVTGWGPPADVVDLARWAAWRWAGRRSSLLRTASPPTAVTMLPTSPSPAAPVVAPGTVERLAHQALNGPGAVLRLAPGADRFPLVAAAVRRGNALVLTPSTDAAGRLAARLGRSGVVAAIAPRDWARAAAGATVVGARAAAWAPVRDLAAVVVLDEHDEAYKEERAPCWHARDVAVERARRAGVPCVLVSPCPSLEALTWAGARPVLAPTPSEERAGWPVLDVVDRRSEEPGRAGLYSPLLVERLRDRSRGRALCVLNRTGRARLLACAACGELARCERCDASVAEHEPGVLSCRLCAHDRPMVCAGCGASTMRNLRVGVSRAREELEALVGETVGELTGKTTAGAAAAAGDRRVVVGTEAVLHAAADTTAAGESIGTVAFLDLDQELLASRYRAAEETLAMLARAARLLGGRRRGGRLLVQTRLPQHPAVLAALHGDPTRVSEDEWPRRRALGFPPAVAMALVSGAGAPAFVEELTPRSRGASGEGPTRVPPDARPVEAPPGPAAAPGTTAARLEVSGPADGRWLVRAPDHESLCDALAAAPRPPGRLRLEVDPLRA